MLHKKASTWPSLRKYKLLLYLCPYFFVLTVILNLSYKVFKSFIICKTVSKLTVIYCIVTSLGRLCLTRKRCFWFSKTPLFRFFFSLWCYLMFIEWFTGQITAGSVCKRVFRCSSVAFENCFADHISSRRFLLICLRPLLFKKEKVIMCFRIGIFWFVFTVLASFLAYSIYSFNRRARALFRGVHYVIIPKEILMGAWEKECQISQELRKQR